MSIRLPKANCRSATVGITVDHLHQALRVGGGAESKLPVEAMRVASEESPSTQSLKLRVRRDGRHQALAHPAAPVRLEGEHVADIGEGGAVTDDAGEADLPALVEGAEAERVLHGPGHRPTRNPPRPVGRGQEAVNHVEVEPRAIRGDDDAPRARLLHPPPPARCSSDAVRRRARARAARSLGVATKMVSSPAIVPTTPASSASSRARATGWAAAGGVLTTTSEPAGTTERAKPRRARRSFSSRMAAGANCVTAACGARWPVGVF